jgi:hypothetical protein
MKSRPTGSSGGGVGMERSMRYPLRLPNPGATANMLAVPAGICHRLCISVLCRAFMMPPSGWWFSS